VLPPGDVLIGGEALSNHLGAGSPTGRTKSWYHPPDGSSRGVTLDREPRLLEQITESKTDGQVVAPCTLKLSVAIEQILHVRVIGRDTHPGSVHVDEVYAPAGPSQRSQMTHDRRLVATVVSKNVATHHDVVPVGIEPGVGRAAYLNMRLGKLCHFSSGEDDRGRICIDTNRVSVRSDPLGHDPKYGTGTAADVRETRPLHDASCDPIGGLGLAGKLGHPVVASLLLLAQGQAVAGARRIPDVFVHAESLSVAPAALLARSQWPTVLCLAPVTGTDAPAKGDDCAARRGGCAEG